MAAKTGLLMVDLYKYKLVRLQPLNARQLKRDDKNGDFIIFYRENNLNFLFTNFLFIFFGEFLFINVA